MDRISFGSERKTEGKKLIGNLAGGPKSTKSVKKFDPKSELEERKKERKKKRKTEV